MDEQIEIINENTVKIFLLKSELDIGKPTVISTKKCWLHIFKKKNLTHACQKVITTENSQMVDVGGEGEKGRMLSL